MEHTAKILVVDDEKGICQNVEKILSKNNYEVVHATSADEAVEKMAKESFSLLLSDIVMPGKNGLELLKIIKKQQPLTKVVMMTAYASTETAVKAIRLGALDYIPKPFTPDELRSTVKKALDGDLTEAPATEKQREAISVIDIDIPFDREEVTKVAGEQYAQMLGPSDMPVVEMPTAETLLNFCNVGAMVCDIFGKLSNPCKAGTKSGECPQKKAKMKKAAKKGEQRPDVRSLVGIDQPFNYQEVVSVTGPEYVENYQREGVHFVPYEELKRKWAPAVEGARERKIIDADIPFERGEVEKHAGEQYAQMLGPSDMPVVEMPTAETLLNFCNVGAMVCDIFGKLSNPCKAGSKSGECPQKKAKKKKAAGKTGAGVDVRTLIGIDQPFNYEDVVSVTGPEYALNVQHEGFASLPYAELKNNVSRMMAERAVKATKEVLVIDDEAAVNNNIRKILTKKGYRVEQALTKEEALRKIEEKTYSLILLDLKMPGVEGLELLRAIRSRQKETMVIIITGYASIETAVESARMGAIDYLAKPFTPDELRKATDNLFSIAA